MVSYCLKQIFIIGRRQTRSEGVGYLVVNVSIPFFEKSSSRRKTEKQYQKEFQSVLVKEMKRVKMLVNSCIGKVNGRQMRVSSKFCAARPREGERHAVKFVRAVYMIKLTAEDQLEKQHCGVV